MIRHFSLKHDSWLNQVEIEISIFGRGCRSRPVAETQTLERCVGAQEAESRAT
jgi:hypothetical protein